MQTIQITLSDSPLEQAVLRLAKEQHQNLQEFVMTALNYYVREAEKTTPLKVQKLNPFQHAKAPTEPFQAINQENGLKTLLASWSPLEEEFPKIAD
jgi:hypothetical protein